MGTGNISICCSCIGVGGSGIGNGESGYLEGDLALADFGVFGGSAWAYFSFLLGVAVWLWRWPNLVDHVLTSVNFWRV